MFMLAAAKPFYSNPLIAIAIAAVVGILFGKFIHDFVSTHNRKMRPMAIIAVTNASLLALVWCCESTFQKAGWLAAGAAWIPQQVYLVPTATMLGISLFRHNSLASWVNGVALAFAAFILMGVHITPSPAVASHKTERVMTLDVGHWAHGVEGVTKAIKESRPTVFCLQGSGDIPKVNGHPFQDLEKSLPTYHFVREGELAVGSKYPLDVQYSVPIPDGEGSAQTLLARVHGVDHDFKVLDVDLKACDARRALHDPGGYFSMFVRNRDDAMQALVRAVKASHGALVVCGSFNAPPQATGNKELVAELPDAFEQSGNGYGYTTPAKFPLTRADRILTGHGLVSTGAWVAGADASDHLAAVADISFYRSK